MQEPPADSPPSDLHSYTTRTLPSAADTGNAETPYSPYSQILNRLLSAKRGEQKIMPTQKPPEAHERGPDSMTKCSTISLSAKRKEPKEMPIQIVLKPRETGPDLETMSSTMSLSATREEQKEMPIRIPPEVQQSGPDSVTICPTMSLSAEREQQMEIPTQIPPQVREPGPDLMAMCWNASARAYRCQMRGCGNFTNTHPHLRFFSFPQEPWKTKQWCERCGMSYNSTVQNLSQFYKICSEHFPPHSFDATGALDPDALPLQALLDHDYTNYMPPLRHNSRPAGTTATTQAPMLQRSQQFCVTTTPKVQASAPVIPRIEIFQGNPHVKAATTRQLLQTARFQRNYLRCAPAAPEFPEIVVTETSRDATTQTFTYNKGEQTETRMTGNHPAYAKLQRRRKQLQKGIKLLKMRADRGPKPKHLPFAEFQKLFYTFYPEPLASFLVAQGDALHKKQPRFSNELKMVCTELLYSAPRCYLDLANVFAMPSLGLLKQF